MINSYDIKKIWVSGNNDMDTDEFNEESLQKAPDNSNAEQPDNKYDESLLDNTIS